MEPVMMAGEDTVPREGSYRQFFDNKRMVAFRYIIKANFDSSIEPRNRDLVLVPLCSIFARNRIQEADSYPEECGRKERASLNRVCPVTKRVAQSRSPFILRLSRASVPE